MTTEQSKAQMTIRRLQVALATVAILLAFALIGWTNQSIAKTSVTISPESAQSIMVGINPDAMWEWGPEGCIKAQEDGLYTFQKGTVEWSQVRSSEDELKYLREWIVKVDDGTSIITFAVQSGTGSCHFPQNAFFVPK